MKKRGVTFIELLIVMTVLSILFLSITSIFSSSIKAMRGELAQSQVISDAQTITDRISTEIKKGIGTEAEYENYTLDSQTLIIKLPAVDNTPEQKILYNGQEALVDYIIYKLDGQTLRRLVFAHPLSNRVNDDNEKILSMDVNQLTFTFPDSTRVNFDLKLTKKIGLFTRSSALSSTASFRNSR